MGLESCQMLAIIASKWYHSYGTLPKKDGTPYKTEKGAFRNHPCVKWGATSIGNAYWLIKHGLYICNEFEVRYGKIHSCYNTLLTAYHLFPKNKVNKVTPFVRAMPDEYKFDTTINTFEAYKKYIASKPWVKNNYLKIPERRPTWLDVY